MERSEARRTESSLTVRGLFEQYREWLEEAGRSRVDDDRSKYRRHIDQPLGRRRAVSVTLEDVERLHRSIADRYPTQANRVVGLIKRTYFFGIRRGLLPQDTPNPATGVEASREPPRKRVLSRQELRHLNDALTELRREALSHRMPGGDSQRRDRLDSLDAIELAIYTAMRLNEVLRLRWDELREDDDELVLTRRKSDRLRSTDMNTVYLPAQVGSIFERRSRESEWVFPGKLPSQHRTSIARVWRQLRKSAGLDDLHFHDLRKIAPTMGMITGESREILGKILGDRTPAVIDRYAHLIDRTPHAAARRIGDAIHRAMNGRELSPEQDQHP
jgi:integrase